jgi:hypothetical protein
MLAELILQGFRFFETTGRLDPYLVYEKATAHTD